MIVLGIIAGVTAMVINPDKNNAVGRALMVFMGIMLVSLGAYVMVSEIMGG